MKYLLILRDKKLGDEWVHQKYFDMLQEAEHVGRAFSRMDENIIWRIKVLNPLDRPEGQHGDVGQRI